MAQVAEDTQSANSKCYRYVLFLFPCDISPPSVCLWTPLLRSSCATVASSGLEKVVKWDTLAVCGVTGGLGTDAMIRWRRLESYVILCDGVFVMAECLLLSPEAKATPFYPGERAGLAFLTSESRSASAILFRT